jgi:hypothetical protein
MFPCCDSAVVRGAAHGYRIVRCAAVLTNGLEGQEKQNRKKTENQKMKSGKFSAVVLFYDAAFATPCPLLCEPVGRL